MKNHFGFAIALSLLFLAPASAAELDLASDPLWRTLVLAPPGATVPQPVAARGGESGIEATCYASCGVGASVSCSGSGSCVAVDQDCVTSQPGYVDCGNGPIYCSTTCIDRRCDHYDSPWCDYSWNPTRNCCDAGEFCPNACMD